MKTWILAEIDELGQERRGDIIRAAVALRGRTRTQLAGWYAPSGDQSRLLLWPIPTFCWEEAAG